MSSEDEEEIMGLFPVIDIGEFEDEEDEDLEFKPSPRWDLEEGDFVLNENGNVDYEDGFEAIKIWCVKAVMTQRYNCLAYSEDYGCELEEAMAEENQEDTENALIRTITEALEANIHVESVSDFEFEWKPDAVHVTFIVNLVDYDSFGILADYDTDGSVYAEEDESEDESDYDESDSDNDTDDTDEDDTDELDEE